MTGAAIMSNIPSITMAASLTGTNQLIVLTQLVVELGQASTMMASSAQSKFQGPS
jgi:hypothetical protein